MYRQAATAGAEFQTISPVEAIRADGCDFVLTVGGQEVQASVVVLATGAIPKKLGVPGETEFTGRGVSWCATCDGPLYRDKVVAVVGGGDSATQEALYLSKIVMALALTVTFSQYRPRPGRTPGDPMYPRRMLPESQDRDASVVGDRGDRRRRR